MLLGEFQHSLDDKGRVFIPARWRQELGQNVVLTIGLDRCIYLMTPERFAEKLEKLESRPDEDQDSRDYLRPMTALASEETIDKQGRMNIPSNLREYAGLAKDVVIIGVSRRGEIWSPKKWTDYRDRVGGAYEAIAGKLA